MTPKVIAAGHICLDVTPVFPQNGGELRELLAPGRLVQMGPADVHTGGSVANTGLGLKALGVDVRLMGKVGADAFGGMVREILDRYGAGGDLIVDGEGTTSYSIVLSPPGVDRIFLHHPGANATFTGAEIPDEALAEASLFHFGYPPLMPEMYRRDGERLAELFRRARAAGCATSLDLAAVDPTTEAGRTDWRRVLERVLPEVDFFVPSVEELAYMLDCPLWEDWCRRSGGGSLTDVIDPETEAMPLARRCLELGAGAVLLKCGAPGLCWCTGDQARLARVSSRVPLEAARWADKEGFQPSFRPERVLSATGAGDTCIAAYLAAALEGCGPEECAALAAAQGACCVEAYDAISGLHTLPWLREKIAGGWAQQEI